MTFRPHPTPRPSASDLAAALAPAARPLPPTRIEPREAATAQIAFRCTPTMAALIGRLADESGSTHRLIARLLADAGHDVPPVDLEPPARGKRTR